MWTILCRFFSKEEQRQGQGSLNFGLGGAVQAPEKGRAGHCGTGIDTGGWFAGPEHRLILGGGRGVVQGCRWDLTGAGVQEQQDFTRIEDLPDQRKQTEGAYKRMTVR